MDAKTIADLHEVIECRLLTHVGADADQLAIALAWEQHAMASGQGAILVPSEVKLELEHALGAASKAFPRLHVAWFLVLACCGVHCPVSSLPGSVLESYSDGSDYGTYLAAVVDAHAASGTLVASV